MSKLSRNGYIIKKNTDIITGIPKPPFLIIDPNGAPIKNITKHAKDKVNFLCHSTLCLHNKYSLYLKSLLFASINYLFVLAKSIDFLYISFLFL